MYRTSNKMRERSWREDGTVPQERRRSRTPSFSSTLLDTICRSIDEPCSNQEAEATTTRTMIKKQSNNVGGGNGKKQRDHSLKRAIMIETWMEKQRDHSIFFNSTSSSSESSSRGTLFSSSETESSTYRSEKRIQMPKPANQNQKSKKQEDGFSKTKLRALKIYGDLKKAKQPISPGGRISSFLNSIFSSGGSNGRRKAKMCSVGAVEDVNFECKSKSACSSASSFSRSCMSNKTPSSAPRAAAKRSVRFYPVSVIVDEDCRPCGHKCIYKDDPSWMLTPVARNAETLPGKELMIKKQSINFRGFRDICKDEDEEDDDDDDAKSCASSDLFELDHLIGKAGRYREELPVYETTSLKTNKAIANGFIL